MVSDLGSLDTRVHALKITTWSSLSDDCNHGGKLAMQYKKVVCRLLSLYTFTKAQFLQIKGSGVERVDEAIKSLELLAKD